MLKEDMVAFMAKRQRAIQRGLIAKRPPLFASTPIGDLRTKRRANWLAAATKAAKRQAEMDRGDPFLFNRAMTQMRLGIHAPDELDTIRRISI